MVLNQSCYDFEYMVKKVSEQKSVLEVSQNAFFSPSPNPSSFYTSTYLSGNNLLPLDMCYYTEEREIDFLLSKNQMLSEHNRD